MDKILPFYNFLSRFVDLSENEFNELIAPHVIVRSFSKKEVVLSEGEVEDYLNFVLKGLVRKFYKKQNEEINTQISFEGHLIHAQESFHSRTPSEYFIETVEPTTFASITYDDLENIYTKSAKMERLGRLVVTWTVILRDKWQMQMVKLSPRERFLKFLERNPTLSERVPQKYLASYLCIKPETFSRFKHLVGKSSQGAS
jgi:CRP-like cAMP-binding protein